MEWTTRLRAKSSWGKMEATGLISFTRPMLAATADDVGLSMARSSAAPNAQPFVDTSTPTRAIGDQIESVLVHRAEQLWSRAAMVKHDSDPLHTGQARDFAKSSLPLVLR
jgi:hypothetical protein